MADQWPTKPAFQSMSTSYPSIKKQHVTCENLTVARVGIEPTTFRFSGGRSYQLSYLARRPGAKPKPLATLTGLEPATSAVTGRRANQLRHRAIFNFPAPP